MRQKLVASGLVLVFAAVGLVLTGAGAAKPQQEPFKVAWIYPGPHNDHGWSQAHDAGRLMVQKALGSKVQTTYKENIFSNAQIPQVVAGLVRDGYKMIFGCSFGNFSNGVNGQLYAKYPDVLFEEATARRSRRTSPSTSGPARTRSTSRAWPRAPRPRRASSATRCRSALPRSSGMRTRSPSAPRRRIPGAKVKLIWTNAWYSPPKEASAAANLVSSGVDVLGQNVDSDATGVYAEKHGIPWAGYDSNAEPPLPSSG